jgi:hypothetical protein
MSSPCDTCKAIALIPSSLSSMPPKSSTAGTDWLAALVCPGVTALRAQSRRPNNMWNFKLLHARSALDLILKENMVEIYVNAIETLGKR